MTITGTVTGDSDRRIARAAGAAIAQYVFVTENATEDRVETAGANGSCYGINQRANVDAAGDTADVALPGQRAKLKLGDTVTWGTHKLLKSDASGYGVPATGDTDYACARPLQGGVSGDIIEVVVLAPARLASS